MYRLGCCSSGPAAGSFGQEPVAVEQGAMTALGPMAPRENHELPWAKLFTVSVLAGLTINWLTKKR